MTLIEYLNTLRRHWRPVVVCTLLGGVLGYLLAASQPSAYRASATVLVSADRAGTTSDLLQGSAYVESLVTSYAVLATSEIVLQPVIDDLGWDTTPKGLAGSVTAASPTSTVLIEISADRGDPVEAQQLANSVADELAAAVSEVSPSIADQPAVTVTTIQTADVPGAPFAPNPRRSSALGAFVGLVLGVGIALLLRALGGRVRDANDAAEASATPVLGQVVQAQRRRTLPDMVMSDPRSAEAESVRGVAANMHYLGVDGGFRSFLVTSSAPAEGKSSVACALALTMTETSSRVLLVDADLRSPTVHELTGLVASVGLSTVLVGDVDFDSAIQHWSSRQLDVLTSGPVPPNPGQLLTSDALRAVIEMAEKRYDVVVVDTGPLSLVSDAVWLGHLVDAIIVVARRGKTKTRALARVLETLAAARTPASGVIVNGALRSRRSKYGYGYVPATRSRRRRRRGPGSSAI